ncbi:hypothetical protein V1517DRAFT_308364 [Lipomyces orientalis]|uniref:Uncharacterized protein n=1 Tax=Lipomyces orientalis TaxID=1233043 RepID=A0ACC3TN41_9ASCO
MSSSRPAHTTPTTEVSSVRIPASQVEATPTPGVAKRGRDGSQNFSLQDRNAMLDAIEKIRPVGPAKWEQVVELYEEYCVQSNRNSRDATAIRRKFSQMVNLPKPTGDPDCPPDVRRAKQLNRTINESLEMAGLGDDDVLDLTEEAAENAGDDDEKGDTGSRQSSEPRRHRGASTASRSSASGEEVATARKRTKRDITESLNSFLDVDRRDTVKLYTSQIEELREELRQSREESRLLRDKVDELREKAGDLKLSLSQMENQFFRERAELVAQFNRERADLVGEKDRALNRVMMLEIVRDSK